MLKLINFSNDPWDLDKFNKDCSKIEGFLEKHGMDGIELIQGHMPEENIIPLSMVVGVHLSFWPIWLDFWREDEKELLRQFDDENSWKQYYRAASKNEFVNNYRNELKAAINLGAQYVVFHVSHVQLEHCYNYKFSYCDDEVVEAFIEMMNEILFGMDTKLMVLFENHWYPGLTYLNKDVAKRLMTEINYQNKGFVLDIGHLMNTNIELKTEQEAAEYMLEVLKNLDELSDNIKVIHLNSSLSGEYVKKEILPGGKYNQSDSFFNRYLSSFSHIGKIDNHVPFTHSSIKNIIDYVKPNYIVYEFSASSLEILDKYIETQNDILQNY